jgi:hypothetical protein
MYSVARHPSKCSQQLWYPPFIASDEEAYSPVSIPSTSGTYVHLKRSALGRSSSTLALTNSSLSTPTLSLSSQSHSNSSMLATNHVPPSTRRSHSIWPNWTRFPATNADGLQRPRGRSGAHRTLRWKGRIASEHILRHPDSDIAGAWEEHTGVDTVGALRVASDASDDVSSDAEECSTDVYKTSADDLTRMTKQGERSSAYSYGYGASEPAYPYLDVYNPSIEQRHNPASLVDVAQQTRSSVVTDTAEDDSIEDELIPIMGGFVQRMATIESFGSREAATSMARSRLSRFSETPASPSLRFATCTPSITSTLSKNNSLGTAYFSASSSMANSDMTTVNERGELEARVTKTTSPPSYSQYHYTRN